MILNTHSLPAASLKKKKKKKSTFVDYASTVGKGDSRCYLDLSMNNSELRHHFRVSALRVRIIGRCFGVPVCERPMHKRCTHQNKCVTHQLSQGPRLHAGHVKYSANITVWQRHWNIKSFLLPRSVKSPLVELFFIATIHGVDNDGWTLILKGTATFIFETLQYPNNTNILS